MKPLSVAVLFVVLAGCAAPLPSASSAAAPTPTPTSTVSPTVTPSPSPPFAISFTCYQDPVPPIFGSPVWLPSSYCPAEEVAVETAVGLLGYPLRSILILPEGFVCGVEFYAGTCPRTQPFPMAAYAAFVGTDRIAAMTLTLVTDGPMVATVVAFQEPPPGWSKP